MRRAVLPTLLAALILLGSAAPQNSIARPGAEEESPDHALLRYFSVALKAGNAAGRLNFRGDACPNAGGYATASRPPIVRANLPGTSGAAAIRSIFRDDPGIAVSETPDGVFRVTIDTVPDAILKTRISTIKFDKIARYNPNFAIDAILRTPEMKAAMRDLGIKESTLLRDQLIQFPTKNARHLPPTLSGLNADEALDRIATTFGGIVIYNWCEPSHEFLLVFSDVREARF